MSISWKVSQEGYRLIQRIADRAQVMGIDRRDAQQIEMDILAAHANGCALRLEDLLTSAPGDFGHDVLGIRRHIDRDTGKLTGHFVPRHAVPVQKVAR